MMKTIDLFSPENQTGYGEREGQAPRALDMAKPLGTLVGTQKHALVSAFLAKHYTGVVGSDLADPLGTITCSDHHSLVTANLIHMGHGEGKDGGKRFSHGIRDVGQPLHTITTKDRFGLVTIHGTEYAIVDIGLRMLTPRELYTAQGFPADYRIDTGADGKPLTKTAQVRMCGNSVCPPLSRAIALANYTDQVAERMVA